MNKKYKIAIAIAVVILSAVAFKVFANCEPIECETGYKAEYVLIEEAIPEVPTTYKCPKFGKAYKLHPVKECMIKVGIVKFYADKVVDVEGTPEIPAVYEWQCVVDEEYVAPEPTPTPEPTRSNGGQMNMQARVQFLLKGSPAQVELAHQLMKEWHWLFPNKTETLLESIARQLQEIQQKINELKLSL